MRRTFLTRNIKVIVALILGCSLNFSVHAENMTFDIPTGLLELEGLGNPVYLFVPEQYQPSRALPLIISLPSEGQGIEAHIKEWQSLATRRSLIVMVPYAPLREGSETYNFDEWLIKTKTAIAKRYRVAPDRIFLVGNGGYLTHYVSYLGTKYGEEFSAAALLDGSWQGPLGELVKIPERASKQLPFFVSLSFAEQAKLEAIKSQAEKYAEKGYMLHLEVLEETEKHSDKNFRIRMLDWLEDRNEKMQALVTSQDKSPKERFYKWVERNIKVK